MYSTARNLFATGMLMLLAAAAVAAPAPIISDLQDKSNVTLSGKVDKVSSERDFTLRNSTGAIGVEIASGQSLVLKQGDQVTVTGVVNNGLFTKKIKASNVQVEKSLSSVMADGIAATTGITVDNATEVSVSQLPNAGAVKLSGTVDKVADKKEFTLKDNTGKVKVTMQSDENAALVQGAHVTVIGNVNKGFFTKKVEATRVIVTADASNSSAGRY